MATVKICPRCETEIPADAPEGLCPRCLAGLAAGDGPRVGPSDEEASAEGLADIAALFPELEVCGKIGRGGMGVVYRVRQGELERFAALKVLAPGLADQDGFRRRFRNEARTLAALNHPNIVTIYDFGERGGLFYFLMEYVDGSDLDEILRTTTLKPREVLAIVRQICDAVQYAHDQGVVHRDLKPGNILLDRQGRTKVADFGVAKLLGVADAGVPRAYIVGTPAYMAPEQRSHSEEVDHRSDIYSLGAVFYELLTGSPPGDDLKPPSAGRLEVDVRLDKVVLRALETQPELRYQQVSELRTGVDRVAEPGKISVVSLLLGLVAVVLAIIAIGFWQAGRELEASPPGPPAWENSVGMSFRPIPGTEVLLATHETRSRDWRAFQRSGEMPWRREIAPDLDPPAPDVPVTLQSPRYVAAFCRWLTRMEWESGHLPRDQEYRLPTDREWSLAAGLHEPEDADPETLHLSDPQSYPWGKEAPVPSQGGNYPDVALRERVPTAIVIPAYYDGYATVAPVACFPPNSAGFHDLGGNVWEMVLASGTENTETVLFRGGSWFSGSRDGDWRRLLSSYRARPADISIADTGFRLARAAVNPDRAPSLLEAARSGDVEEMHRALERGSPVDARDASQRTALHHAASMDAMEIVTALLEAGADANAADQTATTPLHVASGAGRLPVVRALLEAGAKVDARTSLLQLEALHLAAAADAPDVLGALVDAGADVDDPGRQFSALLYAAFAGATRAVEWLVGHGADPNQTDLVLLTPLSAAATSGHQQTCAALLALGADLNPEGTEMNPLTSAVGAAHPKIVELFLANGADVKHPKVAWGLAFDIGSALGQSRYRAYFDATSPVLNRQAILPPEEGAKAEVARLLIAHGLPLEQRNDGGMTPLLSAAYHGQFEVFQALLEAGADATAVDDEGFSALHSAAEQGFPRILEMLLARGVEIEKTTDEGRTALLCAAMSRGDRQNEVVDLLVTRGANVDSTDQGLATPLHHAASFGIPDVMERLLEGQANPNAVSSDGSTPLIITSSGARGARAALIRDRAQAAFQLDRSTTSTPLPPMGSEADYARCARLLLKAGADPLIAPESGRTAITAAAESDQVEIVREILDTGVSPKLLDRQAMTPLHWAAVGNAVRAAELLLERDAPMVHPLSPMTPLHYAASKGSVEVAALLLKRGADPNARDGKSATPLHWAVFGKDPDMVRLLALHGADLEARDFAYNTSLYAAVYSSSPEVIRALVESGANPEARGLEGLRPVDLAKARRRNDIVGILQQAQPQPRTEEDEHE